MKLKLKLIRPACDGDGNISNGSTNECTYCFGEGHIEQIVEVIEYEILNETN